jgi:hypothetical protein
MVEPDWAALEDLDDDQLAAALLEYLDAVMAGRSVEAEDALLAVLPWPLQALWLLSWLEFEVTQGSLLAYFFNSAGRHADLDALGEWAVTQPYRGLPQADILGGSMTGRFWEAAEIDDWGQRLDAYLRRQVGSIAAWGQQRQRPRLG